MGEETAVGVSQTAALHRDAIQFKNEQSIAQEHDVTAINPEQMTPLMRAASEGDTDRVNELTKAKVDLNAVNIRGETALLCAINSGQNQTALSLIDACVDLEICDYDGDNALTCSARLNNAEIVEKLIAHRVNVDYLNEDGDSSLCLAYKNGKTEVVKTFVENGIFNNRIDYNGNTLLIYAARDGDVDLAHFLVQFRADLNVQNKNKFSALISAVQNFHFDVVQILIEAGAILDLTNKYGDTALTVACRDGSIHIVRILLSNGANIEEGGHMHITPLMQAAFHGQLDVVYELLRKGADVNAINLDGDSALTTLCYPKHGFVRDVCQMLVENGADVNLADCNSLPPLFKAIVNRNTIFAQNLIELGANIEFVVCNNRFRQKETPLIMASRMGLTDVVRSLLKHKADINALDRYFSSSLNLAAANIEDKDGLLISLLIQAGADLDYADSNGMTSLMIACMEGSVASVRCLIEAGASINTRHYVFEHSALHFAVMGGRNDIVEILMKAGSEVRNEIHVAIKMGAKKVVQTLIMNGAVPAHPVECEEKKVFPRSSKSPFFTSLLCDEVATAKFLYSIWFFNLFDISKMGENEHFQRTLKLGRERKTNGLFRSLSSQPQRLVVVSFVSVSSAVGFHPGREQRVHSLNLPTAFKKRLLFQDEGVQVPVEEWADLCCF